MKIDGGPVDARMVLCMEWCIWMREDSAGVRFAVLRGVF